MMIRRLCVVAMGLVVCAGLIGGAGIAEARTPRFDVRAIHLQLLRALGPDYKVKSTKDDVIRTIRAASKAGFNTVILSVTGSIQLEKTPAFATPLAFSISETREIVAAARKARMEVIPHLDLLTHQERFIGAMDKSLMLSKSDYDPTKPQVYATVFPVIDEIIEIFKPRYFHIGHDEVYATSRNFRLPFLHRVFKSDGFRDVVSRARAQLEVYAASWNFRLPFLQRLLKPEEFLADVIEIRSHLKKRGIKTVMWADMLLSPERFGGVYQDRSINGVDGYEDIINGLPKDIILCDWHYRVKGSEFPSYTYLQGKGFVVWGASWQDPVTIKAFSDYVARHGRRGEGMIATTWWEFVSQNNTVVDGIIGDSSKAFFK